MRRIATVAVVMAVLTAGCGGDDAATTTTTVTETTAAEAGEGSLDQVASTEAPATTEAPGPSEFQLTDLDNGAVLEVRPGDAVLVRLAIEDPANPQWMIAREPDPSVLEITDSLLWAPSEPGSEVTHFEFVFYVVGEGETAVTFSYGPMTPTSRTMGFTVRSSAA